jgi:lysophospholipase L1-like esterase
MPSSRTIRFAVSALLSFLSFVALAQAPAPNSAEADFGQMKRYRAADQELLAKGQKVDVVFLGDSLTQLWGEQGKWFHEPGWINRGIGGQTTSQLLLRERQDALSLHPRAILLEGGGNDMRLGFTPQEIRDNFLTMAELAESHRIAVFVATMTPTCDCFRPLSGLRTVERIAELNRLLAEMCKAHHWQLIDLNPILADAEGKMKQEMTFDGVHPNEKGYSLLSPVVEEKLKRYR